MDILLHVLFDWDEAKNLANQKKHHLSFEEAIRVFRDPLARTRQDRNVDGEERWQTIGTVGGIVLIVVAHTIQQENDEDTYRIISARKATPSERIHYEETQ